MVKILKYESHTQPFKGYFNITRVHPGKILGASSNDLAFGPLSNIDHAFMKKGLTVKMHEHKNDEILSYVWRGTSQHRDSADFEAPIEKGKLMLMNAGESFWHEEKVKNENGDVEMLQIFVRPKKSNLPAHIQFHEKPLMNEDWYLMAGPEGSEAPLFFRQNVYIYDAHPKAGQKMQIPDIENYEPFLYVLDGELTVEDTIVSKYEAVTSVNEKLSDIQATKDSTLVLFLVDMDVPMSLDGTISGV
ncbi:pirin family protein [Oceanobacillus sp. CAU 1775]